MKKQAVKHGFALKETHRIEEINATANIYEHEKSGAQLMHIASEDNNKVFCVAFKTIPEDSTGCPHILEHSVLNGSKNFPGKSTFMELIKGSLHTFINAMTASDVTLYPVASTNDKDFLNLTRVYLDAVFFPRIHEEPKILHQEGWHYELTDPEGELTIKGVVYNEMKGAFSNPDSIIQRHCQHAQFPDTPYGHESGGDPEVIPTLSYEKFTEFHKKYYHPDNSRIFIYGDLDPDPVLEMMDKDYLSHFTKGQKTVSMPLQKPFAKQLKLELEYPVDEHKNIEDQYYLCLNYTWGQITEGHTTAALSLLSDILMSTPASPLKRKIMESGLAADSYCYAMMDIKQPTLIFTFKQVKKENIPALVKLVNTELMRLVKDGIDKKLIEAVINKREFFVREAQMQHFPKGLFYIWSTLSDWMHGGDPVKALRFEPVFAELRKGLTEPYFEALIEKAILKNQHSSQITFVPVPGLVDKQDRDLKAKLAETKKKMSKKQIKELVEFNRELHDWQNEEVSAEDLERIPMLSLEDIDPSAESYPNQIEKYTEFTLLKHPLNTNGIVYLKAYFDLSHAEEEDLPWLAFYASLSGLVDTQNYSYADLSNEIDINTGGISLQFGLKNSYVDPDLIMPKFIVSGKALQAKVGKLVELAAEHAFRPVFTDKARLGTLIREAKSRMEAQLLGRGVVVAINRMFAPFSQIHHFSDLTQGLGYYHFLIDLEKRLAEDVDSVIKGLDWIRETFFTRNNLILSLTSDEEGISDAFQYLKPLVAGISQEVYSPVEIHFHPVDLNEGIMAPVQVQFCAKGGNFFRKGYSYSGKLRVLNNILANEFLHREIREKGGAYGAMANFSAVGNMYFCSYRDPNLSQTLDVYNRVPEFLRNFDCSSRELEKYIIGDISILNYPKTPETKGAQADEDYITGFTQEDRQQIRDEVLSTRIEDIRAYADMIEAIMSNNHFCVFGNEARIREAGDLFDRLTPVFI
ncbi:MAG: insulinase family protein [Candidatus Syntrophosphaera sp.]|nr:insulinase family protein [Candidatus Syntrophosphaera sp.]